MRKLVFLMVLSMVVALAVPAGAKVVHEEPFYQLDASWKVGKSSANDYSIGNVGMADGDVSQAVWGHIAWGMHCGDVGEFSDRRTVEWDASGALGLDLVVESASGNQKPKDGSVSFVAAATFHYDSSECSQRVEDVTTETEVTIDTAAGTVTIRILNPEYQYLTDVPELLFEVKRGTIRPIK